MRVLLALLLLLTLPGQRAAAHPHVWITVRTEVIYNAEGRISGVRHRWTFDEAYSAFAVQGLDKDGDGKLSSAELAELAQVNVESLHEFDFFTFARANGVRQAFDKPVEPLLTFENAQLTLSFILPLKVPASRRTFNLEVYDPTYFVAFSFAEGDDAVTLARAPQGCARTLTRPKPLPLADAQRLSEDFFSSLAGATFGANFINRVLVACP